MTARPDTARQALEALRIQRENSQRILQVHDIERNADELYQQRIEKIRRVIDGGR